MSYLSNRLLKNPAGLWLLDETTGIIAADSSGNAHDGEYKEGPLLGQPSLIGPGGGTSILCAGGTFADGVQIAKISDPTSFGDDLHGASGITFEIWVDFDGQTIPASTLSGFILEHHIDAALHGMALQYYNDAGTNKIRYRYSSNGTSIQDFTTNYTFSGKSVIHFVLDFLNGDVGLYVNGSTLVFGATTFAGTSYVFGSPTRNDYIMRGYATGSGSLGYGDAAGFYPSAFSQADALAVYNEGQYPQVDVNIPAIAVSVALNAPSTIVGKYAEIPAIDGSVTFNAPFAFREPENVELLRNVYQLVLTGDADATTDLILPMTSFQSRQRTGSPSYLSVTVPDGKSYIDEINLRLNGHLVINKGYQLQDGTLQLEEIARVNLEASRTDDGTVNESVTLTGHKTITYTPKTRTLTGANYRNVTDGVRRFRTAVDNFLNPGDTAIVNAESIIVDNITYTVGTIQEDMEIEEAV